MKNPDLNFSSSSSITIADLPPCGPYVSFENSIGESLKSDETIDFDESALYKNLGCNWLGFRDSRQDCGYFLRQKIHRYTWN